MNRADLIALIRQSGRRKPKKRSRRMLSPDGQRLRYFAALRNGLLRDLRQLVEIRLVGKLSRLAAQVDARTLRQDAGEFDEGDVHDAIDALAEEMAKRWTSKRYAQTVQPFAQDVARFSREQLAGVLKDQIGIDVVGAEPWLEGQLAKWTSQNVTLVKDIPREALRQIETKLVEGLHSGQRWEDLAKVVQERLGVAESRANLIARDQVGKLFGQINREREKQLGITGYIWRTVKDNRVRDEHEDREGVSFKWGELPENEEPGQPVQCRCYSEPDLGDVFKEAFGE